MRRRVAWPGATAVGVAAVVAASLALVHVLGPRGGGPQLPRPQDGIVLSTRVPQPTAFFGDAIVASATAFVDTGVVDAGSVRLHGDFAPFHVESRRLETRTAGRVAVLRASWTLSCLDPGCLPGKRGHAFSWAPLRLDYRLRGTRLQRALTEPFEPVTFLTRVPAGPADHPRFRVAPPVLEPPRYRIAPATATLLLVLAGIVALGVALALAALALRGLRRRPAAVDPLAVVLAELDAAARANGDTARRRRALERLAELLDARDAELGGATRTLAWGPADPPQDAIADLVRRAREARG